MQQAGAQYLAVAYPVEGMELRQAGISLPILVLTAGTDFFPEIGEELSLIFLKGENSVHDVRGVPIRCLLKWLRAGSSLCCRTIEIREGEVCNVTRDVVGRLENMGE